MTNRSRRMLFHDQDELIDSLYRVSELADAIFAITESGANEQIKNSALLGVFRALVRDAGDLIDAAERNEIVVTGEPRAEANMEAKTHE